MYFLGYTKIHVGYSEIQFKSIPPPNPLLSQYVQTSSVRVQHVRTAVYCTNEYVMYSVGAFGRSSTMDWVHGIHSKVYGGDETGKVRRN